MEKRINELCKLVLAGELYPEIQTVQYDRLDEFLPVHEKNAKRIYEYVTSQKPVITKYSAFTGLLVFDGSCPGDAMSVKGLENIRKLLNEFYRKPVDNLSTFEWQHSTADFSKIIRKGIRLFINDIEVSKEKHRDNIEKQEFLSALKKVAEALIEWAHICSGEAKKLAESVTELEYKNNLNKLSDALLRVPEYPAENFYEAVLSLYVVFSYAPDSIGTLDRTLSEYYFRDIDSGVLTREEACGYLQELFLMLQAKTPIDSSNFTRGGESHFCVGGYLPNGEDCFNDLSLLILEAMTELPTYIPQISLRWTKKLPFESFVRVLDFERNDKNKRIAFVNDETKIRASMNLLGFSYEEACSYTTLGCNEGAFPGGMVAGNSNCNGLHSVESTFYNNHLHTLDIARDGKRPMIFSRFCGYGSQRYPVGFSGDNLITWESLAFLPYFTATASNIGYSWWSHDIGGHMHGYRDDELLVRWIQWGVFSPINRLHSCPYEFLHKEPWFYDSRISSILKNTLRLRHRMFPYIYTMNYRNHKELIPFIQPMYYTHPKNNGAYEVKNQYWFGSEVMVAPIVEKNGTVTELGRAECWFPQGEWFDMFDGTRYISNSQSGRKMEVFRPLESYPVFAKTGAIIPLAIYQPQENRLINSGNMEILVFPGANNSFTLYEDEGDYNNYQNGKFVETNMRLNWSNSPEFVIEPANGDISLIPEKRNWKISLRGFAQTVNVDVFINGKAVDFDIQKDNKTHTIIVELVATVKDKVELKISGENLIHDNSDVDEKWRDILQRSHVGYTRKEEIAKQLRTDRNTHKKLMWIAGQSIEEHHLEMAIRELLTLSEDEYDTFVNGWSDP